jgi:hypothetical protein
MKGDLPLENSGVCPTLPRVEQSQAISTDDLNVLCEILPMVDIPRLEKSGQISIRCKDGELYVSCADELHGAIFYGRGKSDLDFGVFPQDSALLRASLEHKRISVATLDGRILVKSDGEVALIPTTQCIYIPKEASAAKSAALLDVNEVRNVLSAVASIASSKDASPVMITLNPPDSITIKVSSSVGSLSKKIDAKVAAKAAFGISYQLLSDLTPKLGTKSRLSLVEESGSIVRIQFTSNDILYAALTSDDQ